MTPLGATVGPPANRARHELPLLYLPRTEHREERWVNLRHRERAGRDGLCESMPTPNTHGQTGNFSDEWSKLSDGELAAAQEWS